MILKPQDVVILLKLVALGRQPWTYQRLAVELSISQSEVHAGVRRSVAARLMSDTSAASGRPILAALKEFLNHGVRYAYPPEHGGLTRGMPTAYAAPPLNKVIVQPDEPPPVWPYAEGTVRGHAFAPLYPSVPVAAAWPMAVVSVESSFARAAEALEDARASLIAGSATQRRMLATARQMTASTRVNPRGFRIMACVPRLRRHRVAQRMRRRNRGLPPGSIGRDMNCAGAFVLHGPALVGTMAPPPE